MRIRLCPVFRSLRPSGPRIRCPLRSALKSSWRIQLLKNNQVGNLTSRLGSLAVDESHIYLLYDSRRLRFHSLVDSLSVGIDYGSTRRGVGAFYLEVFEAVPGRVLDSEVCNHYVPKTILVPLEI